MLHLRPRRVPARAIRFTHTFGLGGKALIFIVSFFSPETVGGEGINTVWRGFATVAGSWIGGGATQTAMLEVYGYNPDRYVAVAVHPALAPVGALLAVLGYALGFYGAILSAELMKLVAS